MGRDCYGPSLLWAEMSRNPSPYLYIFICKYANNANCHRKFHVRYFNLTLLTLVWNVEGYAMKKQQYKFKQLDGIIFHIHKYTMFSYQILANKAHVMNQNIWSLW